MTITGKIAKTITMATTTIGKLDEITKTTEKPDLPTDFVVIAKNLDTQLPNVGFAHKFADRLNYPNNKILPTNPNRYFPDCHSLNPR